MVTGGLGGGAPTCIIQGGFYSQWAFGLLAMPVLLGVLYALIVLICYMTTESSTAVTHLKVALDHQNDVDILVSLLKSHIVFGLLDEIQLHKMATVMDIKSYKCVFHPT